MKLFFASYMMAFDTFKEMRTPNVGVLTSFVEKNVKPVPCPTILDSGAFSIMSGRSKHTLDQYMKYLHEHGKEFYWYAGLDVIGNAQASYENMKIMEDEGLTPVPTFHYQSDRRFLIRLLDKYPYIGLGGLVPIARYPKRILAWLRECYSIIPRGHKIHLWGMSNKNILMQIPAFSYDSTSWKFGGRMGYQLRPGLLSSRQWVRNDVTRAEAYINFSASNASIITEMVRQNNEITELWAKRGVTWNE